MSGAIPALTNTPSWRGAQLKHKDNFTFTYTILRVFSHLRLGLPNGLSLQVFPTRILYTFLICAVLSACPVHLILLITFSEAYITYTKCRYVEFKR
jgi:hypothetical protein